MRDLRVGIALSMSEMEELKSKADRLGITLGEFIRYAVFQFIKAEASAGTFGVTTHPSGLVAATKAPQFHGSENLNHVNIES